MLFCEACSVEKNFIIIDIFPYKYTKQSRNINEYEKNPLMYSLIVLKNTVLKG